MSTQKERIQAFRSCKMSQFIVQQYRLLWILTLSLQVFIFIAGFFLHVSSLILNILTLIGTCCLFLLYKDQADEKAKAFGVRCFKINIYFLLINLSNAALISSLAEMIREGTFSTGFLTFFLVVMDVVTLLLLCTLMSKQQTKDRLTALTDKNLFEELIGEELKPGDAVIGIDVDTKKQVIHPLNDRYLHYLFLGPTGSGKTALSLTPMVWRDLNSGNVGVTVIEPKGDFAEKVYAMAKICGREVVYFNPILKNCPYFNPLFGPTNDVVENMATTFNMFSADSSQFFQDANDGLLRRGVKIVKGLYGNDATLVDLSTLLHNTGNSGRKMVQEFQRMTFHGALEQEREEIALWFLNDYYTGLSGDRGATKTFENTSAVRTQIAKLNSNPYLKRVLNAPKGAGTGVDFAKALEEGSVLAISTAQGTLQDLGKFLGYFIILQFQSSVFRRPGNEDTRKGNMLYIDEFQVYSNMGFANMLTQGRSYRVASHLATQNRALIGANAGKNAKAFIELVSTNARNTVIYGGGNHDDAKYYSNQFGEKTEHRLERSYSRPSLNPLYGIPKSYRMNESFKEAEKVSANYTASDIIYQEFGFVTYSLIKRNSLQPAGLSKLDFIPYDLKVQIDELVAAHNAQYLIRSEEDLENEFGDVDEATPITVGVSAADAIQADNTLLAAMDDIDENMIFDLDLGETLNFASEAPDSLTALDLVERFEQEGVAAVPAKNKMTLADVCEDDI